MFQNLAVTGPSLSTAVPARIVPPSDRGTRAVASAGRTRTGGRLSVRIP
jgi:hypothetical protein